MSTFNLKVVTAEKMFYEGDVNRIVVRTTEGDVGILPNHVPYIAALSVGALTIFAADGSKKIAAVSGGFVQTDKEGTTVLARTCEWADEIDVERAEKALEKTKAKQKDATSKHEQAVMDLKLKKAVNRMRVAGK